MFPILAFGALILGGLSTTKMAATAVVGATVAGSSKKSRNAKTREVIDVNPEFERRLAAKLREIDKTPKSPDEEKALELGLAGLSEVPLPAEMLPKKYQDLAGFWYVTRRDEVILWYFLMRVQAKHQVGQVSELLEELSKKSRVPMHRIDSILFGVDSIDHSLESIVRTIRDMSQHRYDSPVLRDALRRSKAA